jgi:hypothetical protein
MKDKKKQPEYRFIQSLRLSADWDHREALASVRVGEVIIDGISVWRNPRRGTLRVNFPGYPQGHGQYGEAIELPAELRSEIEEEVLAQYREKKKEAAKSTKGEK